jgi:hypothetical protein
MYRLGSLCIDCVNILSAIGRGVGWMEGGGGGEQIVVPIPAA